MLWDCLLLEIHLVLFTNVYLPVRRCGIFAKLSLIIFGAGRCCCFLKKSNVLCCDTLIILHSHYCYHISVFLFVAQSLYEKSGMACW